MTMMRTTSSCRLFFTVPEPYKSFTNWRPYSDIGNLLRAVPCLARL
jgi:hypothetical protein